MELGSRLIFLSLLLAFFRLSVQETSDPVLHGLQQHFHLAENVKTELFSDIQSLEKWSNNMHGPSVSLNSKNGCSSLKCMDPMTFAPRGSPCGCVLPIQVGLHFNISLYRFLPLLSELSREIAVAISLKRSQVRFLGLNATDKKLQNIRLSVILVPTAAMFTSSTAFSIYTLLWNRGININTSIFGAYEVLYVRYPGLPQSPTSPEKPEGCDTLNKMKSNCCKKLVIVTVVSSMAAFTLCIGLVLMGLSKFSYRSGPNRRSQFIKTPSDSDTKASGGGRHEATDGSMSISNLGACTGRAKMFGSTDIRKITNYLDDSRIIGEGGFGVVYEGILEDGRKVAVKLLKQGSHGFVSELEILGRLHHKNIVQLKGICADEDCPCLIYDLVPNGSVESHLHGADKEIDPLDWSARMKIALGTARGLAYLHEDSSPPVIHRDFKASNILLEYDYTPKISDFGLATTTEKEGSKFTHVMGTFGYLAPEYAMTGHLLVKSDVYSYGVFLLELLTGRKPIDLARPLGQENLVAWARPLVARKGGTESMVDPFLRGNLSDLENCFCKVAEIAGMCVDPEESERPSMGEVVQALKLVMDEEFEENKILRWRRVDEFSVDLESKYGDGDEEGGLQRWVASPFGRKLSVQDLKSSTSASLWRGKSASLRELSHGVEIETERKGKFWDSFRQSYSGRVGKLNSAHHQ